uniref:Ig-like domain-containing protein n=1 Tax=Pygocentrus nattereri TaxID=42514 RepID=A0A3B4EBH9_PYGNA
MSILFGIHVKCCKFYIKELFIFYFSGGTSKIDIPCLNGLKHIVHGRNINLTCFFSSADASATAWFKQTPGEKPLLIASVFRSAPVTYHNGFNKSGRFNAVREKSSFNLSISNAEPSDSATYYCAVANIFLSLGSSSSLSAVLQPPVSDPVELGGNTTLQCSILTDASAGDHSVYWFRHGSGESHPGIIYTHGNRSGECEKSSETDSPTQSCVYKLPKRNLSLSDAGTYYCAVLMCGQIIFGNGTKLDFVVALSLTCALRKPVTAMSHLKDLKNIWLGNTHPILILCKNMNISLDRDRQHATPEPHAALLLPCCGSPAE